MADASVRALRIDGEESGPHPLVDCRIVVDLVQRLEHREQGLPRQNAIVQRGVAEPGQKGEVARHVADRRVQPSVGDRRARIEIVAVGDAPLLADRVVVPAEALQMIRRDVEIAPRHAERREDVLVDIRFDVVAGHFLDHQPQ